MTHLHLGKLSKDSNQDEINMTK